MMASWTEQMGYPLLKVTGAELGPGAEATLTLEQAWFLVDGDLVSQSLSLQSKPQHSPLSR